MVRELKGPLNGSLIRRSLGGILVGRGDLLRLGERPLPPRVDGLGHHGHVSAEVSWGHVSSCWLLVPGCAFLSEAQTQLCLARVLFVDTVGPFCAIADNQCSKSNQAMLGPFHMARALRMELTVVQ